MFTLRNNLFFLGLLAVVASIIKPPVEITHYPVSLWFPLEYIANNNRWICIGICLIILITSAGKVKFTLSGFVSLAGLQFLFFLKNYDAIYLKSILLFVGFLLMLLATKATASQALRGIEKKNGLWVPVKLASFAFIIINVLQYYINPVATMLVGERYHGITSNPLMFALSASIIIPTLLYQYKIAAKKFKWIYIISFISMAYFIYLSGSRLGLLLVFFSVSMFYRSKFISTMNFIIPLLLVLALWTSFSENVFISKNARIFSTESNRVQVWANQVDLVWENPLWGVDLGSGERLGFGENSYLSAGVAVGISGIFLIILFAFKIVAKLKKLLACERVVGWQPETSLAISILATSFVAAFFEAFFLGIFTFPLILLIYAMAISDGLVSRALYENNQNANLPR